MWGVKNRCAFPENADLQVGPDFWHPTGPGGLADFLVHLGPAMQALWSQLGTPSLDPQTVDLLTKEAGSFGGTVAEVAAQRDDAEIRLMRALDEISVPQ